MPLLDVRSLTKSYPRQTGWLARPQENFVVQDVSFSISRGETLGVVGESGSGKSTVARMVLGLVPPTSGEVLFAGQSITQAPPSVLRKLRRRIQPVFQDPYAALNPRMTVSEIIQEPFKIHQSDQRNLPQGDPRALLASVGLDESALRRYPHEFSGGQRQRINIARALALQPDLLILDEPVSALDVSVGAQIVNLLRQLQQSLQLTCLFISHSVPLVRYLSTNIAVMHAGRLIEMGECEELCRNPREPYTRSLLEATPVLP